MINRKERKFINLLLRRWTDTIDAHRQVERLYTLGMIAKGEYDRAKNILTRM